MKWMEMNSLNMSQSLLMDIKYIYRKKYIFIRNHINYSNLVSMSEKSEIEIRG